MTVFLYVEDDMLNRQIMDVLMVRMLGHKELTIFEDSVDFEKRLLSLGSQPDLIFLDIHVMPLNGFDMLRVIRSHTTFDEVPVVALTASVMNEEIQALREAGFNGLVAKPINQDSFPSILERILNGEEVWQLN